MVHRRFRAEGRGQSCAFIQHPVVAALGKEGLTLGGGSKNAEEEHRATLGVGLCWFLVTAFFPECLFKKLCY